MRKENKLLITVTRFMIEHGIECEEDIYQNDKVDEDSLELIEDLFNIIKLTNHTCNCSHKSNSRDNEHCCRCDSRQTNANRIRNMSDEELADILFNSCVEHIGTDRCVSSIRDFTVRDNCRKCVLEWLQSEAE